MSPWGWLNRLDQRVQQLRVPNIHHQEDLRPLGRFFGWLLVSVLSLGAIAVIGWFLYLAFYRGSTPEVANPALQLEVPKAAPIPSERTISDPWKDEHWLTPEQARNLRTQENVINLALLEHGGAFYSSDHTIVPTSRWQRYKAFGMRDFSSSGTAIQFIWDNFTYNLNVHQPFVLSEQPDKVYMFDITGNLWQEDLSRVQLIPITDVHPDVRINPNPNLSYTLQNRRQ